MSKRPYPFGGNASTGEVPCIRRSEGSATGTLPARNSPSAGPPASTHCPRRTPRRRAPAGRELPLGFSGSDFPLHEHTPPRRRMRRGPRDSCRGHGWWNWATGWRQSAPRNFHQLRKSRMSTGPPGFLNTSEPGHINSGPPDTGRDPERFRPRSMAGRLHELFELGIGDGDLIHPEAVHRRQRRASSG